MSSIYRVGKSILGRIMTVILSLAFVPILIAALPLLLILFPVIAYAIDSISQRNPIGLKRVLTLLWIINIIVLPLAILVQIGLIVLNIVLRLFERTPDLSSITFILLVVFVAAMILVDATRGWLRRYLEAISDTTY